MGIPPVTASGPSSIGRTWVLLIRSSWCCDSQRSARLCACRAAQTSRLGNRCARGLEQNKRLTADGTTNLRQVDRPRFYDERAPVTELAAVIRAVWIQRVGA